MQDLNSESLHLWAGCSSRWGVFFTRQFMNGVGCGRGLNTCNPSADFCTGGDSDFTGGSRLAFSTAIPRRVQLFAVDAYPVVAKPLVFSACKRYGVHRAPSDACPAADAVIVYARIGSLPGFDTGCNDDAPEPPGHPLFRDNAPGQAEGPESCGISSVAFRPGCRKMD